MELPRFGIKILAWIISIVIVSCLLCLPTHAATVTDRANSVGEKDYDFSWLDPEKKIYVLQNRRYRKAKRMELLLGPGLTMNNTLVSAWEFSGKLAYYFSESYGIDVFYKHKFNRKSGAAEHFEDATGYRGLPRQVNYFGGMELIWIPFYAKVNSFNHIFYIDFGGSAGIAWLQTEADRNLYRGVIQPNSIETETAPGLTATIFQKYYITEHFGVRYDLTTLMYRAKSVTPINTDKPRPTETLIDWDFYVHLSVLF